MSKKYVNNCSNKKINKSMTILFCIDFAKVDAPFLFMLATDGSAL